jgi:signal transduction histidine kinase
MRRLLGPVGGPLTFFLIAALVFAGLGWVTVAALRVEEAQREAAARAELGNNLRVALWRLDGRMLPALGVEDSRPFYHYTSADPLSGSTAAPTPLLAAPLPDWMKLHVQLDPATGWESPQVLSPEAADRVSGAWPDLPLRNNTHERAAVLAALNARYAAAATCDLLAARERAAPADGRPFAAPLFDPQPQWQAGESVAAVPPADPTPKPPPPPGMAPAPIAAPAEKTSETFRLFGWDLPRRDAPAGDLLNDRAADRKDAPPAAATGSQPPQPQPASGPVAQAAGAQSPPPKAAAFPPAAPPAGGAVGRATFPPLNDNERQWLEYRNRSGTISRGVQEAKNAGLDLPMYGRGAMQQNSIYPFNDGRGQFGNWSNPVPGGPGANPTQLNPNSAGGGDKTEKDNKDKDGVKRKSGSPPGPPADATLDKFSKDAAAKEKASESFRYFRAEQYRGTLTEHLATVSRGLDRRRCLDEIPPEETGKQSAEAGTPPAAGRPAAPRLVPPAEDRPAPAVQNPTNSLALNNAVAVLPPAVNIHLGSMRPQWIGAADGTETLVLVRAAKIDNRTVYQGVVLDWAKLEQVLKDEVRDLFPGAALVPVKDAVGVSPDRAMTALPVQLDPGPAPAPPPVGWTPLRLGLVLAWVAALVAFAAVGFSGWSLIDLAERRIRFVSAVTHELRTPLTSLRLYLDLLMSGMIHDEAKRQEYLNTLATESDRLHRLIDNVLDFAKLEKRAKNGDMKPVRAGELVDQLRGTWTDRVAADGKELVVISTLPAETEVLTDPAMVYQIVGNLIDNARKYTRDAEDRRIWLWAKPGGPGRVVFEVEDRGPGVPAGERKSIFKPFRRGAKAETTAGGAGLGLALAKQWAEVLGGTVAYRPAEGAPGACFRLELPVK